MRIYTSCEEAVLETERDLFELGVDVDIQTMQDKAVGGSDDYKTKELSPHSFELIHSAKKDRDFFLTYFNIPKDWAEAEFEERVSEEYLNPGKAWKKRKEVWAEYLHNDQFAYTYNERMMGGKLGGLVAELKAHPGSRQTILNIYEPNDRISWGGVKRIPCSLHYQFMIRPSQDPQEQGINRLNMIYVMRSNDYLTFFGSDNWFALALQDYIANMLGINSGRYIYMTSSLHAYYKDLKSRNIF